MDRRGNSVSQEREVAGAPRADVSRVRAMRLLVAIALGAAFAHNVSVTWERWGDLIVDTGRELDTPKQLAEGKVLYRDVRYWYGPLAPYWHALLYRVFGVRIGVLTTAGMCVAAGLAWVSYRLLRMFVGRWVSALGAAAVLYIQAFGCYRFPNIFNFVLPYSFPAAYGMLLATGSVLFLARYLRKRRGWDFYAACLLLGLTGLCKLEPLFAALVAHGAFVLVCLFRGERNWRRLAIGYGMAAGIVLAVLGGFRWAAGPGLWRENLFIPGNVSLNEFLLKHSGMDAPLKNLTNAGWSLLGLGACLGLGLVGSLVERRVTARGARAALGLVLLMGAIGIIWQFGTENVFAGLPLMLLAWLVWLGARVVRRGGGGRAAVVVLLAFGLAAMLRMGLTCSAEHYGFYLMVPGLLGLVVVACELAPAVARKPGGGSTAVACGIALLVGLTTLHIRKRAFALELLYPRPTEQMVRGPRGAMVIAAKYVGSGDRAVSFLSAQPRGTPVVVLPEGSAMTFLSGCDNPLGVHTYLPPDFSGSYDESGIVSRLAAASPEFVLFDSRDVREYGKTALGTDYGQALSVWVNENYSPIEEYISEQRGFGVRVYRRQ